MAFYVDNFIPTIWSAALLKTKEIDKECESFANILIKDGVLEVKKEQEPDTEPKQEKNNKK